MGRNSRRKQTTRLIRENRSQSDKYWKFIAFLLVLPPSGLLLWSSFLASHTFIPNEVIILAVLGGGVPATIVLFYVWRKDPYPIWVLLFYGFLIGSSITLFTLIGGNYYLKSYTSFEATSEILRTGNKRLRRSKCATPYVVVAYNNIESKVKFPCKYEQVIKNYRRVKLKLSEGIFGYYVIRDKELVK